ncbi:tRNA (adenosine(37)-N6)-dimethylallyltransferase MiaA [Nocardioides sp.]|uniref:tRNA (adenosine(37)-N6)-dimethylallyltransferase MiaA n=1 Tax=Nocardioides sp. TaxID=35761 RepID=UPI0039E446F0
MPRALTMPPIVAVVGATAAGKTGLSLDLAEALDGEIVNTDAMAVYRGMDIGTAKVPPGQRRGIPHHLLDLLEVTEQASVAEFQRLARAAIAQIRGRGRTPILVGGSALYTRAVLDRFDFPGTDPEVRRRLELEWEAGEPLFARLAELDPVSAERIERDNGRRIVRALEVIELTGKPFSARLPVPEYADDNSVQIGVDIDRDTLDERIKERVAQMFADGFVEEVSRLPAEMSRTAATAIGYREVASYLRGELSLAEAMLKTAVKTRQFARRQDQWFRKDARVRWVPWDDPRRLDKAVAAIRSLRG